MKWRDAKGNYHELENMDDDYIRSCYWSCISRNWQKWANRFMDEMNERHITPTTDEPDELDEELNQRLSREV